MDVAIRQAAVRPILFLVEGTTWSLVSAKFGEMDS